jgi:hypothetical protein
MDWSNYALRLQAHLALLAHATARGSAADIRKVAWDAFDLASEYGMAEGQPAPDGPSIELLNTWRSVRSDEVRCGDASGATAHELVCEHGSIVFKVLAQLLRRQPDDEAVVAGAKRLIDGYLDRRQLSHLRSAVLSEARAAMASTMPVFVGNGVVEIGGSQVIKLPDRQADVVQSLVELRACSLTELRRKSLCDDANKVLSAVVKQHPILASHIKLPGGNGRGGYSTTIINGQ